MRELTINMFITYCKIYNSYYSYDVQIFGQSAYLEKQVSRKTQRKLNKVLRHLKPR